MKWGSVGEFLTMGGYGLYVWGSYAIALALMVIEPFFTARRHQQALRALNEPNAQDDQA